MAKTGRAAGKHFTGLDDDFAVLASVDFGRLSHIHAMALPADGKIVAAGFTRDGSHFNLAATRLLRD